MRTYKIRSVKLKQENQAKFDLLWCQTETRKTGKIRPTVIENIGAKIRPIVNKNIARKL